jgi:glycosyltransferase involved in cell wall biosynthesis
MPDVNRYYGNDSNVKGTGGWMGALLELLKDTPGFEIGVVTACEHFPESRFRVDGIDYFIVKQQRYKFRRSLFPVDNSPVYVKKCADIVNDYKPDLIHVHGTERFYAQLMSKEMVRCPLVISVQGIMDACSEWYRWFGKLSIKDILTTNLFNSLKFSGLLWELREAKQQAKREKLYFEKGKYFFGRTEWDKSYIAYSNDHAKYFEINEVLRKPFWHHHWKLNKCKRHRIIFTNTYHPRKGTELLLEAVKRLKPLYPDIKLVLIGSLGDGGYATYIKRKINDLGEAVKSPGQMNAEEIADELCNAHVFISASYIDNSPNSLAEAQLVGMPVISSYTGGIPTMVKDGETGLLFPTGDIPLLVSKIKSIFEDDALATRLGENAMNTARERHDPERIVRDHLAAYKHILKDSNR